MMKKILGVFSTFILLMPSFALALDPNDPYFYDQWYLNQINVQSAWNTTTGSDAIIVAILDAGVDIDHEDLAQNIWVNTGEIPGNGIDDDGNGYIDDVYGWDFVDNDASVEPDIGEGANTEAVIHGSLVAGIVGAVGNNRTGVVGVNWRVKLMPVRMLDRDGSGTSGNAIRAIQYAVMNGADVINLSFSGTTPDPNLIETIRWAHESGVVIVSALGNDNTDVNTTPVYPACYDGEDGDWIIGVAASDALDQKADYSNYGSDCADISAPGSEIFGVSFYNVENGFTEKYMDGWSGTSMAAPLVSGAVALLLAKYPQATPSEIKTILQLSVDPLSVPANMRMDLGTGRLNIGNAFAVASTFFQTPVEVEVISAMEPLVTASLVGTTVLRNATSPSVYDIAGDTRRVFMNAVAYFTYFDSFDAVATVEDTDLASYQLAGLILPKPGTVLVKIQSVATVYAIAPNPSDLYRPYLRAIKSEEIAVQMYGNNWADYVIDIEPTFFSKFSIGAPITSPESVNLDIMKTRVELAVLSS